MTQILTFNDLPQVVAELRDEVVGMKQMVLNLLKESSQRKESAHKPMTVDEAAEYMRIPLRTLYMKLADGTVPATKPGKRYILYRDELDKWLDSCRKHPVPMSAEEWNNSILACNHRKPERRYL